MEEKQGETDNIIQQKVGWENCFEEIDDNFVQELTETIRQQYSENPTEIQLETIKTYLERKKQNKNNLFLIKSHGYSGKTLAMCITAIIQAMRSYKPDHQYHTLETIQKSMRGKIKNIEVWKYHPKIIILADTKILSYDISEKIDKLIPESFKDKIKVSQINAGQTSSEEIGNFEHILVSTPQIAEKFMNSQENHLYVDQTDLMVIDEAELVYESFQDQLYQIVQKLEQDSKADLICASNTLSEEFKQFAQTKFKKNNEDTIQIYQDINLKKVKQFSVELPICENEIKEVEQVFGEIVKLLKQMYLEQRMDSQVIIYCDSKQQIEKLSETLLSHKDLTKGDNKMEFNVIHSKLGTQISQTYENFRNNKFKVLICTDIVNGTDLGNVGLFINVFSPRNHQNLIYGNRYVKRISRSGIFGLKGVALTFFRHAKRGDNTQFEIPDRDLSQQVIEQIQDLKENDIEELNIAGDYIGQILKSVQETVMFNHSFK